MNDAPNELAVVEPTPLAAPPKDDCDRLLTMMEGTIESGGNVEALEKLVTLYDKVRHIKAEQQFNEALQRFQSKEIAIPMRRTGGGVSAKTGKKMTWKYANRDDIMSAIGPALHECGLGIMCSETERHTYAVTLRHSGGHSVTVTKSIPQHPTSTIINALQASGVEQEYALRYGIVALLNLAKCDEGAPQDNPQAREVINDKQVVAILQLLERTIADKDRFLGWLDVTYGTGDVKEICQGDYVDILNKINEAAKARAAKGEHLPSEPEGLTPQENMNDENAPS